MDQSQAYQAAKKRVEAKMVFYTHLVIYLGIIGFLALLNFVTSPGVLWFHWPMMGWGIAVVLHAFTVFVFPGRLAVTEQMIEKEMGRSQVRS